MAEIVNLVGLALAIGLFVSCVLLVRPANGTRPLLLGFMASALFGIYIGSVRVFHLQHLSQPVFGYVFIFWLAVKLWSLYAAALHTPRPFRYMLRRALGYNPDLDD